MQILTFLVFAAILAPVMFFYLYRHRKKSKRTEKKITKAREYGTYEPVHIYPKIDYAKCIGSGACIKACPEKDILGLSGGKGKLINASHCIGHGACAAACPVGAITLVFGTAKRGVEIPYVTPDFETNIKGVFIVGELGGMGLIKNAVTQGTQAVDHIACQLKEWPHKGAPSTTFHHKTPLPHKRMERKVVLGADLTDILVVGAGPAGIGASLNAFKHKLSCVIIDQNDLGGTVLSYPRHKIVMTSPMDLPMYGKVKLRETTKEALLLLWREVFKKTGMKINSKEKMTGLKAEDGVFRVTTTKGEYMARKVVIAIGRRGTPRKLGVPGEDLPKVTYSLLDAAQHQDHQVLVVGGGDSAVEAAIAIADQPGNKVTLSYRGDAFSRIKPGNRERLDKAAAKKSVNVILNSNVKEITEKEITLAVGEDSTNLPNDYVYIFAGGELPNEFLKTIGIQIEKKFGTA